MDEPFGALDTKTRSEMQELVKSIWMDTSLMDESNTIVFVTHDIPEAVYLGDDILIMGANPGRIIDYKYIDPPLDRVQEVKATPEFMEYVQEIERVLREN